MHIVTVESVKPKSSDSTYEDKTTVYAQRVEGLNIGAVIRAVNGMESIAIVSEQHVPALLQDKAIIQGLRRLLDIALQPTKLSEYSEYTAAVSHIKAAIEELRALAERLDKAPAAKV